MGPDPCATPMVNRSSDHLAPQAGPRPRRRPSWADRERERHQQRWHRLLDAAFSLRVVVAVSAAALLLGAVDRWENCRLHRFQPGCLTTDTGGIISVGHVESLSIISAAFLYLLEGNKRRRREHHDAMELILSSQQAGLRLSYARNEALEQLSAAGLWLDGLDLSEAQLEDLRAPHARWRRMILQRADLRGACLHDADLQGSDLREADLRGADLRHADLREVRLHGARLQGADLRRADLLGAEFEVDALSGCRLDGARIALNRQET